VIGHAILNALHTLLVGCAIVSLVMVVAVAVWTVFCFWASRNSRQVQTPVVEQSAHASDRDEWDWPARTSLLDSDGRPDGLRPPQLPSNKQRPHW